MKNLGKRVLLFFVFCLAVNFYSQDFIFFEENQQNDWDYVNTFKTFAETNSYDSGEELKEKAIDFYATEDVAFFDCSMPVTQITLSALFYQQKHSEKELGIDVYIDNFKKYFISSFKKDLMFSGFSSRAASRLQALENAESFYPQKKFESDFSESDLFSILNNPRVLFVILNNQNYSSVKRQISDATGVLLGKKSEECFFQFSHENFMVFPTNLDECYEKMPDEQKLSCNEILYKFSDGITKVYEYAVEQNLYFSDFFLKEEMDVLQNVLDDSFSVFALSEEQLSYFSSRFENILKYVAD